MKADRFVKRTQRPEAGNKYYIRKAEGGYSDAIKGNPTDKDCNVLSNCVGYAYGRFNEIGGWGSCKYLAPVNAADFINYKGDLKTGETPRIGACMVWKNGGSGHVAIVEQVVSDTEVLTSESAWDGDAFYTVTRKKGNGNWGYSGTFLGFIYNPAECCQDKEENILVGDVVDFVGETHYLNPSAAKGSGCRSGAATVTAVAAGKKHPYHLIGGYFGGRSSGSTVWGWVDEKDITVNKDQNIANFISAAISDGITPDWNKTLAEFSSKCLVQQWRDNKSRYPELTGLAQKLLGLEQTGVCDAEMTAEIKAYQKKCGLTPDGGIGRKTWQFLLKTN